MTRSLNVQSEALSKYNEYLQETAEVERAIFYTGLWLQQDKNVKEVAFTSSYIVHVTFKNGLQSNLVFLPKDENGKAIYRGAPNTSGNAVEKTGSKMPIKAFGGKSSASKSAEKEIKNKKVLVFNVEEEEFYSNDYSAPLAILSNNAITDLEVTVLSNEAASLQKIDEFYKYGLIIINTHGRPGSFSVKSGIKMMGLEESFTDEVIDENILKITGKNPEDFKNGLLTINFTIELRDKGLAQPIDILEITIGVTDKYIRNLKPLDDAVVFANFCYSGHEVEGPNTRNLVEAFKAIGAKTYYGWATDYGEGQEVDNAGAQKAELQLLKNLVSDGDLTGDSHKKENGEAIVMSYDNYEDFAPGLSVYTILPYQDGTINFIDSYQKLWVNNQRPHPETTAVALHHHIDPDYYYDGCKVVTGKNGVTSKDCGTRIYSTETFLVNVSIRTGPQTNSPSYWIKPVWAFEPRSYPGKEVISYHLSVKEFYYRGRSQDCGIHKGATWFPDWMEVDEYGTYSFSCNDQSGAAPDQISAVIEKIYGDLSGYAEVEVQLVNK